MLCQLSIGRNRRLVDLGGVRRAWRCALGQMLAWRLGPWLRACGRLDEPGLLYEFQRGGNEMMRIRTPER